jgi:hypothetical protein
MNNYDVGIIGMGVAGSFACLKISKEHKNMKIIAFDIGRPPAKRRRQLEGFLGCLPNSDGKLYLNDINKLTDLVGLRKAKSAYNWFNKTISNVGTFKTTKDKPLSISLDKKFKKAGFQVDLNDYIQIYPRDIHSLSKYMAENIEANKNVSFRFDSEVVHIQKQKNIFIVQTEDGTEYRCKKIILAVGRSGWRWANRLFTNFGIIDNNDVARYGIRIETSSTNMKDFNRSNCTISKEDLELGPFSWYGTVIPEDHSVPNELDLAISAFRSNENRWKTDKVSFNLIGNRAFTGKGCEETDRIGKLTFVLANDRIIKERISTIISGKSKISIIPEYDWLKETLTGLNEIIPEIISKGYFHVPTIIPMVPKINLGSNLESEVNGMFIVGESAGQSGILSAALTGIISADAVYK